MKMHAFLMALQIAQLTSGAADISKNPSVVLGNEKLYLAYVEGSTNSEVLLNEYIRKDETLEKWNVLFSVRYVSSAKSVDEVVGSWKAYLARVRSPGQSVKEDPESTPLDRRFILAIRPPGDAYLETDQMRFIPMPAGKGVIYYQAAVRVNTSNESEMTQSLQKQVELAQALASVAVQPIDKMSGSATPDSTFEMSPAELAIYGQLSTNGIQSVTALTNVLDKSQFYSAVTLYSASSVAFREKRIEDSGFLFFAARFRALFDNDLFPPTGVRGDNPMVLFGALNQQLGAVINPALSAQPQAYSGALKRLKAWNPEADEHYRPGWEFAKGGGKDRALAAGV